MIQTYAEKTTKAIRTVITMAENDNPEMDDEMRMSKEEMAEQNVALEDALEEEEWESDWGATIWAIIFLIIILGGIGVACWQPWVV